MTDIASRNHALTTPLDPRRSLAVTDQVILNDTSPDATAPGLPSFTLRNVLEQLARQMGSNGQHAVSLFQQLWDTANPAPGRSGQAGPHCSDNARRLNGFPYICRNAEGLQAAPNATINIDSYTPIGLFNRFDLAPADGSNCGEYRVVFARNSSSPFSRSFIIFEGVLPNPQPQQGLEGCRPVASFWANLSQDGVARSRAVALRKFFFRGLPGFAPVIHLNNYGANSADLGQVRVNMFLEPPWMLREFKLRPRPGCTSGRCTFAFFPVTDKTNPLPGLFGPRSALSVAAEFQNTFLPSQVARLAVNDINRFNYLVPDKYNTGQSDSEHDNYNVNFGPGPSTLRTNIQRELDALRSSLTPDQIVARAEALSCAGCHQQSGGRDLGGGLTWPSSLGFVHVTERQTEPGPDGPRFAISPALTGTFLPHRQAVLQSFLGSPSDNARFVAQSVPTRVASGSNFTVSITMTNTSTSIWRATDAIQLGSQNPQDNVRWGRSRVPLAPGEAIVPGQGKTFTFVVTAPRTPGTYAFQWRMLRGFGGWFGDFTPTVSIVVLGASTSSYGAAFVSQSVPTRVAPGSNFTVSITLRNSGTSSWRDTDAIRLGSENPQNNILWNRSRVPLAPGEVIAPGQTKVFSFIATAPSSPGTYAFQWRMLRENVERFGAFSPMTHIAVAWY